MRIGPSAGGSAGLAHPQDWQAAALKITIPARLNRAGNEMKKIVEDVSDPATPDASLARVLVRAHVIRDRLLADKSLTLDEIAQSEDCSVLCDAAVPSHPGA